MPRHDWFNDDTMSRESRDRYSRDERGFDEDYRERGAMFGRDREDFNRSERQRSRGQRIGGWGGLMGDESSGARTQERDRYDRGRSDRAMGSRHEEEHFGSDDYNRGIPMDETERLIASNKVEGTPVYDRHGDKLGTVHNFMVDKRRGNVVYAVLRHGGGFLGLGERYYPLEWNQLTFDTRLGGYAVDLMEEDLESFGSFDASGRWRSRARSGRSSREMSRDRDYSSERSMHEPW